MRVIFASHRIEFTTGYRIDAAKWDADKQRVKNGCTNKLKQSASDINTDLLRYYTIMQEVFKEYEVKDIMPTPQEIKDSFNNKVNPAMEFAELIKGKVLNFTGRLFSSEHNRWFATENTSLQILRDNDKRLTLTANRIPFSQWFNEQYDKLRQSIRQPIQPRKSKGMKL